MSDLVRFLASSGHTGTIELSGRSPGTIAMHDGRVTVAAAHGGQSLEELVVGSGAASAETWADSTMRAGVDGSLVDLLIASGTDEHELAGILREHAIGSLAELIISKDGAFEFVAGMDDEIGSRITFDTEELLRDTWTRVEAWREIAKLIPSTSSVLRLPSRLPTEEVTIDSGRWALLALADGRRTVAEMVTSLGMSAFVVLGQLRALIEAGLLELVADPADQVAGYHPSAARAYYIP